jgi:hypothetical protein
LDGRDGRRSNRWTRGRLGRLGRAAVDEKSAALGIVQIGELQDEIGVGSELVPQFGAGGRAAVNGNRSARYFDGAHAARRIPRSQRDAFTKRQDFEALLDANPQPRGIGHRRLRGKPVASDGCDCPDRERQNSCPADHLDSSSSSDPSSRSSGPSSRCNP